MILRAILLEPEATLYPYGPCHAAGMAAAHALSGMPRDQFQAAYVAARNVVKQRLGPEARNRMLYFQALVEQQSSLFDPAQALAYHEAYWGAYIDAMQLSLEAATALEHLKLRGIQLGLVSNVSTPLQLRQVQALGLPFDAVVTADEAGAPLPDPAPIELALDKLGLNSDEVWIVGLAHQALIDAAEFEQFFAVYLDAEQTGRRGPHAFGVAGWPGFQQLIAHMANQPDS